MKFISIFLICLIIINVYSFKDNNWEYGDNVIIEWKKGNFNRKCQAFSIFQNEKLLKSNIPIINDKIDFGDIDINGIVNLKCDKFVKQKRETLDNDKGMSSEQENEESSIIESEEEDKSIINSIDNSYDPSKENESEKEEEIVNNKNNLSNNESKESNSNNNNNNNQDNKTSNQDMNNKDKQNLKDKNSSKISANDSDGNYKKNDNNKITNKENEDNDEKSDHNTMDNNNDNNINKSNNKSDNHTKNDTVDKNKNKNNNDINDVNDDDINDKDKPKDEDEKDEDISLNKTQLITGLSSAFLLTGGMFVSVLKIRKMSDLQLEMNAQEMSADSVYIPSPKLSKASSMSSMEFRSFSSTLQEDTMRSSVSSLIV